MITASEQEVYNALTYRWQTGIQIKERIAGAKNIKRYDILIGPMYSKLDTLVEQGFAEENVRGLTDEEKETRGEREHIHEYKKIDGKTPNYEKRKLFGALGKLAPA